MKNLKLLGGAAFIAAASVMTSAASAQIATSTHARQTSITVAPNQFSGTQLGGSYTTSGTGTIGGAGRIPTIAATGIVTAAATSNSTANDATFTFSESIGQADIQHTSGTALTALSAGTSTFGDAGLKVSDAATAVDATMTINAAGAVAIAGGTKAGTTTQGIISSKLKGLYGQVESRRVVTGVLDQTVVDEDRQETTVSMEGHGLVAITAMGSLAGAAGAAGTATAATATAMVINTPANYSSKGAVTAGDNSTNPVLTSLLVNRAGYGKIVETAGGTVTGGFGITDINTVTGTAGGTATSTSLSYVNELTVFN